MLLAFALSLSSFVDPYERFVMLLKSRSRTHHPRMHYSYTWGRRRNMLSIQIHPKMFYSYTRSEHKNMLDRFFIHQINAPSFCCYFSKLLLQKRGMGMQKLFIKKERKRKVEKMDKCPRYQKQWVVKCPPEKRDE